MQRDYLIVVAVMAVVFAIRLWLLVHFWRDSRRNKLAISTAQLLVAIGVAIAVLRFGADVWIALYVAVALIVGLAFIPVQKSKAG